ncbi:MAG: helix-turn-helix transcriptional regulator [Clostridia bacterium]|nr:helix-turn-helix transcriptional regulator [Clostridia bacterium]
MMVKPDFVKSISAISKVSPRSGRAEKRKTYSFNIRLSGSMQYDFGEKRYTVNEGEMIFLPKGSSYTYDVVSAQDSKCTIITLDADFEENSKPMVYPLKDVQCAGFIMNNFSDAWNFGNTADKYKCISYLYDLLAYITNYNSLKYMEKKKFEVITPALDYLKTHIYDTSLKADELALLCGISNTYFRKIFFSRFKTTPKNYITEKRLAKAKAIIDCGEFNTVRELALSVGYEDSLYFSKIFKKHFGIPPATMNKF